MVEARTGAARCTPIAIEPVLIGIFVVKGANPFAAK